MHDAGHGAAGTVVAATRGVNTITVSARADRASWLLVPYMVWISFAAILNFQIDQRNPDAETLVPAAASTQIG